MKVKVCSSHIPYCIARVKARGRSLCCRYGWCSWAVPIDEKKKPKELNRGT